MCGAGDGEFAGWPAQGPSPPLGPSAGPPSSSMGGVRSWTGHHGGYGFRGAGPFSLHSHDVQWEDSPGLDSLHMMLQVFDRHPPMLHMNPPTPRCT